MTPPNERERDAAGAEEERILSMRFGGRTVRENLGAAIAEGRVVRNPDGSLSLPAYKNPEHTFVHGSFEPDCEFLNRFLFSQVYGEKAVPFGCRDCYKVKVETTSLRQLIAAKDLAETFACASKSGSEVDRPETQALYGTYFFLLGLDKARAVYAKLRAAIDNDPRLGPSTKVVIKRGCTNYERACGPSDKYTFDPRQAEVEAYFRSRFRSAAIASTLRQKLKDALILLNLVRIAYRIGDRTYKDFTGGKEFLPPTVDYAPDAQTEHFPGHS